MQTNANKFSLNDLNFDNRFVRELPGDIETENYRRQVHQACYSRVKPVANAEPILIAYSPEMAADLELSAEACEAVEFKQILVGNQLAKGMDPYACCYGGHQFGHWAGQLGDGRVINLGEAVTSCGNYYTLQLKGAGLTPYSRSADGLAVLRSSVREFLCSEAMFHLGIPTTRALSLILTGNRVTRDMFYDGNPQQEPGAVVCRVAPSFIRFGSLQIFTAQADLENLKKLLDFTIHNDFPHLGPVVGIETYLHWFAEVCQRTADLIVHWQRVGFVHGVMNTDNMSVLGLTIDYGPYGWIENFDPDWTPNTTDAQGRRYRFGNQPQIAQWNLVQLANAIYPLIKQAKPLQDLIENYASRVESGLIEMQKTKLGLRNYQPATDVKLFQDLAELLQMAETDMTIFYRGLAEFNANSDPHSFCEFLAISSYRELNEKIRDSAVSWLTAYQARLHAENWQPTARHASMDKTNPRFVLRNYLAQEAIDLAEQGDFKRITELLSVLKRPYDEQPEHAQFAKKRPDWAKQRPGCSMLSCSS